MDTGNGNFIHKNQVVGFGIDGFATVAQLGHIALYRIHRYEGEAFQIRHLILQVGVGIYGQAILVHHGGAAFRKCGRTAQQGGQNQDQCQDTLHHAAFVHHKFFLAVLPDLLAPECAVWIGQAQCTRNGYKYSLAYTKILQFEM